MLKIRSLRSVAQPRTVTSTSPGSMVGWEAGPGMGDLKEVANIIGKKGNMKVSPAKIVGLDVTGWFCGISWEFNEIK